MINVGRTIFIIVLGICIAAIATVSSCQDVDKEIQNQEYTKSISKDIIVFEYDGCEYIVQRNYRESMLHKGNCKYCLKRMGRRELYIGEGIDSSSNLYLIPTNIDLIK